MSLLDETIIAEVRETLGDDTLRGFVDRMLSEAATTADDLAQLYEQGDLAAIAKLAHRSAGSAVSVGASRLYACLKEIEDAARLPASAQVADLITVLPAVIDSTRSAMQGMLR